MWAAAQKPYKPRDAAIIFATFGDLVPLALKAVCAPDLPPTGVPIDLRKSGVARLIDLRGG